MNRPLLTTLLTALLLPVLAGCGRSGQSTRTGSTHRGWPGGVGSCGWEVTTPNPVAGLDHARVAYAGSGDFAVLLWTDLNSGGSGIGSNSGPARLSVKGSFQSPALKKPIDFQCQKDGPNSGSATIDGAKYDLAKGSLFLISTKGERPIVKQLNRDITRLEFETESLKSLAKTDPEILAFFAAPEREKPAP